MHMLNKMSLPHLPWAASESRKQEKGGRRKKSVKYKETSQTPDGLGKKGREVERIQATFHKLMISIKVFLSTFPQVRGRKNFKVTNIWLLKRKKKKKEHDAELNRIRIWWPIHLWDMLNFIVNKAMRIKTTVRYQFTLPRLEKTFMSV